MHHEVHQAAASLDGARTAVRHARQLLAGWVARVQVLAPPPVPAHYEPELAETMRRVRRHTMTSYQRLAAVCDAARQVSRRGVPGAIVECGVWRGGSTMAAALTLLQEKDTERDLYLFDTYTGMSEPGEEDEASPYDGYDLRRMWKRRTSGWHAVPVETVRANMESTGYPAERMHYVEGPVEVTVPGSAPDVIALLRLDTDWYASTLHELEHLWPRLSPGGVLILDDYGHYAGARRAVDEYFDAREGRPLLQRVDYTGRMAVKEAPTSASMVASPTDADAPAV